VACKSCGRINTLQNLINNYFLFSPNSFQIFLKPQFLQTAVSSSIFVNLNIFCYLWLKFLLMSIQNFIETAEFKDFDNLTEDVYNSTMSIVTNILKTFDKSKIDKYKFNESIRGLIHKSNNLTAEDKYLLDMEVNAFITLHLLDS